MLDRVYRAVAWQRVDQIHYNILLLTPTLILDAPSRLTESSEGLH
jgi:hypothetical protein